MRAFVVCMIFSLPGYVVADDAKPAQWAVLIAVKSHVDASLDLSFTINDVQLLKKTLTERAGIDQAHILELHDEVKDATRKPTLANLRREVPAFLSRVGDKDRVLVFFAGHGMLHRNKTYLIPRDAGREMLDATALPASEFREALSRCKAKERFLILDCCHAGGGGRSLPGSGDVPSDLLAAEFKGSPGVVLASCTDKQFSWEWNARRQGLFTYWLCRGLEGGADSNGDGTLTEAEVYKYVFERVTKTAKQEFGRMQTPVRVIGSDVEDVPPLLSLWPESPATLFRRLAEHLDLEIRARKAKKVGVVEFLMPLSKFEALGSANLPRYCSTQIQKTLTELAGSAYQVLNDDETKAMVTKLKVGDLGDPVAMSRLRQSFGVEALVSGSIRRRGLNLSVQADLIDTESGDSLVTPTSLLPLSEDLLGDLGLSYSNLSRPANPRPHAKEVVMHALAQAQEAHPLANTREQNPNAAQPFPFEVSFHALDIPAGKTIAKTTPRRKMTLVKLNDDERSEMILPAKEGQIFEVRVKSHLQTPVAMTLLVDGMNSLGQNREILGAKERYWVLQPRTEYAIEGWFFQKDRADELRRFKFVDASRSVAGRQGYGEAIGAITAAFYGESSGRPLGVGEGPSELRFLERSNFKAGRLLGVVNVRYVDERELK
jgi:hypothetical protein